ncbi:MAG: methyltransferase domain-containing protein [Planctomycetes bacterium]|nr:methyltransferase domain-containing protein [Planctomycetota bacterium]
MNEVVAEKPAVRAGIERSRRAALRALVPEGFAGLDLLDLGCGAGDFARLLVAEGLDPARLLGVDRDEDRLRLARSRLPAARFVAADLVHHEPAPAATDLVVLSQVLSQIADRDRRHLLDRAVAALRPAGRLLVHDMRLLRPRARRAGLRHFGPRDLRRLAPSGLVLLGLRRLTLLPPLLRVLAPRAPALVTGLERCPFLLGHWLALLGRSDER